MRTLRRVCRKSVYDRVSNENGEEWKRVRARLTPTFSSAKIRAMDPLIQQCCRQMISFLNQRPPGDTEIELKMLTCRFTLDLIGCTAFGIDCASLKNPEAEFVQKAEAVFTNSRLSNFFFFSFGGLSKSMLKYMPVSMFNSKSLHYLCDVISSVMKDRELDPTKRRKDFLQYLMDSGQNEDTSSEKKVMDDVMIKSQALGFFVAGSETSSTTLSFACAVMAHTPDLQDKLRNDIQAAVEKAPDLCPYDLVNEIPLLEKVLCETLRLYSPLPRLERACSKEYQFPDSDVRIKVGDSLVVPIPQIMRDPQYFPDPEAFDPERFSPEEIKRRPNEVFMPFGSGPRICIGMRFAMISMKLFLFHFLTNFKLTPSDKTRMPFAFDKRSVMLKADHGLWVNIEPLKDN